MIHTCSYYCDDPEHIKAQRDELRETVDMLRLELVEKCGEIVRLKQENNRLWRKLRKIRLKEK